MLTLINILMIILASIVVTGFLLPARMIMIANIKKPTLVKVMWIPDFILVSLIFAAIWLRR